MYDNRFEIIIQSYMVNPILQLLAPCVVEYINLFAMHNLIHLLVPLFSGLFDYKSIQMHIFTMKSKDISGLAEKFVNSNRMNEYFSMYIK